MFNFRFGEWLRSNPPPKPKPVRGDSLGGPPRVYSVLLANEMMAIIVERLGWGDCIQPLVKELCANEAIFSMRADDRLAMIEAALDKAGCPDTRATNT